MNLFSGLDGRPYEAEMRQRNAPLVVAYGAGSDSTAMVIEMLRRGIRPDVLTFADTGGEKPGTYDYLWSHWGPWCDRNGLSLVVLPKTRARAEASLEQQCLRSKDLPSRAYGYGTCAYDWKLVPQWLFLKEWAPAVAARARGALPVRAVGFALGEDHRATVHLDEKHQVRVWYPLIEWGIDRAAERDLILSEGLPLPPKSACFFCPSSTKREVVELARTHPDLVARALAMEANVERSTSTKGLGREWSWTELLAADEEKRAKMREAPVESCTVCVDGGELE